MTEFGSILDLGLSGAAITAVVIMAIILWQVIKNLKLQNPVNTVQATNTQNSEGLTDVHNRINKLVEDCSDAHAELHKECADKHQEIANWQGKIDQQMTNAGEKLDLLIGMQRK